jgi:DNA-binding CsgD family transcriptional regulator
MTTIHSQLKPSVGVVLLDAQLRLVHYTREAATILGYTGDSAPLDFVKAATRFQLTNPSSVALTEEFTSGRRRYRCRAFLLDSDDHAVVPQRTDGRAFGDHVDHLQPRIAVVLERVFTQPADITRWSEAYQLTHREYETVKLLMKGLTSKEIANEMSISPSTVKSFLKLVMAKVGASNRTAIIAKILEEGVVAPRHTAPVTRANVK